MKTQHSRTYVMQLKQCLVKGFYNRNANIIKEEKAQINSLDFYLQNLEKKEKTKPKLRIRV